MQRLARTVEQLCRRDDLAVVDVPVLGAVALGEIGREIRPRHPEDLFEWQSGHRPDALEHERRAAVRLDDTIRGVDDKANAIGERPVEIPEHCAGAHGLADSDIGTAGPAAARTAVSRRVTRGTVSGQRLRRRPVTATAGSMGRVVCSANLRSRLS